MSNSANTLQYNTENAHHFLSIVVLCLVDHPLAVTSLQENDADRTVRTLVLVVEQKVLRQREYNLNEKGKVGGSHVFSIFPNKLFCPKAYKNSVFSDPTYIIG